MAVLWGLSVQLCLCCAIGVKLFGQSWHGSGAAALVLLACAVHKVHLFGIKTVETTAQW